MRIRLNRQKKGFTLIELMVVIAILAALVAVGYYPIVGYLNDGDRQAACVNLKLVQTMLLDFSQDNGSYPCDATADALLEDERNAKYNFGELKGEKSNPYFRQLFYLFYKGNPTEDTFYAKHNGTKEPDEKFANGQALTKGENAFAYVLRKESTNPEDAPGKRAVSGTSTPLAFCCVPSTPKAYTGDKLKFNRELFFAHAFMVKTDGSLFDLKDKLQEDGEDDTKSVYAEGFTPFPKNEKGRDTSPDYLIVTPDLM